MVDYRLSYLLAVSLLVPIWFLFFFLRKDLRKEMIVIGFLFGTIGVLSNIIFVKDWWHPINMTNTPIGPEDIIYSFLIAGISSVIFKVIFKKKMIVELKDNVQKENFKITSIWIAGILLFSASFYVLKIHSFYAFIISFSMCTAIIWLQRKDLILPSLISGFLTVIAAFPSYVITEYITPGWIERTWYLNKLSGIIILYAPLEDMIFHFWVGTFIGILFAYWKGGKIIKYENN